MLRTSLLITSALTAACLQAQVTAVDFGAGNLVNLAQSLLRDSGITHTFGYDRPFSTDPMNPNLSHYFGPEFYGGYQTSSTAVPLRENFSLVAVLEGPPGPNSWEIAGGVDALSVQYRVGSSDLGLTYRFLILFRVAEGLSLGPDSRLGITLKHSGPGSSVTVRPVVGFGNRFRPTSHLALETTQNIFNTNYTTLTFTGLNNPANWRSMTSMFLSGTGPTFGSAPTSLPSTIDSIGFLITRTLPSSGVGSDSGFQISRVNAVLTTAIPESANVGLLVGCGALGIALVRRRTRRGRTFRGCTR